jgi:hypothetical protein
MRHDLQVSLERTTEKREAAFEEASYAGSSTGNRPDFQRCSPPTRQVLRVANKGEHFLDRSMDDEVDFESSHDLASFSSDQMVIH